MNDDTPTLTVNPEPAPHPTLPGRITIVDTVYHREPGASPTSVQSKFGRDLKSGEQAYIRRLRVNQDWEKLDQGWLKDVSYVVILNLGKSPNVIELGVNTHLFAYIRPGESCRFEPVDVKWITIRCPTGPCPVSVNLFPA